MCLQEQKNIQVNKGVPELAKVGSELTCDKQNLYLTGDEQLNNYYTPNLLTIDKRIWNQ